MDKLHTGGTSKSAIVSVIVAVLLGGCATLPDQINELVMARNAVAEVDSDPMAERVAGAELKQAKAALQRAEQGKRDGADLEQIVHDAYLANRHADIVEERIAEARIRDQIERSEAERTQVLLNARSQEASRAKALAELRSRQAELQRRRADAAVSEAEQLADELQEMQATQTERGLVLTLSDVLFDTDKADLKPGASGAIDRLSDFLSDNSSRRLLIEGHTDSRGADAYNQPLSERRANAVREALISQGVAPEKLRAVGRGETFPVATNNTAAGRQENRRVEVVVSDREGKFPASAERLSAVQ